MKQIVLLLTFLVTAFAAEAQIYDPVKWNTSVEISSPLPVSMRTALTESVP